MDQDETSHGGTIIYRPRPSLSPSLVCLSQYQLQLNISTSLGLIVLAGNPAPLPKRAQPPILAHVSCSQTAGWIKMPLGSGTEVGLSPCHIVRWRPISPMERGTATLPRFRGLRTKPWSMSIAAKHQDGSRCHLVRR